MYYQIIGYNLINISINLNHILKLNHTTYILILLINLVLIIMKMDLLALPAEVSLHVFSYIPPTSYYSLKRVNKDFNTTLNKLQEKYFLSWFQGNGSAKYLYPQIHKILKNNEGISILLSLFSLYFDDIIIIYVWCIYSL